MTRTHWGIAALSTLTLVTGLAACGNSSDDSSASASTDSTAASQATSSESPSAESSATGAQEGQTVDQACTLINNASQAEENAHPELSTSDDQNLVMSAFHEMDTTLSTTLTNDQVATQWKAFISALDAVPNLSSNAQGSEQSGASEAAQAQIAAASQALSSLNTLCPSISGSQSGN